MSEVITPEVVVEMGRKSLLKYLPYLTVEERLNGLKPSERLDGLNLNDIEAYLKKRRKKS
ncbi:hypothetical protein QUF74_12750 [Candidatus Halobeggiatoa sp. HSG11]|nr:hypothetical protein [Candidatus Halobeggiatoa sp. HSG11]